MAQPLIILIVFLGTTCVLAVPVFLNAGGTYSMAYIGTVQGKSFFAESTNLTWGQANITCNAANMRLATVKTQEEVELLAQASKEYAFFKGYHWVAGHDAQNFSQFVWDDDNSNLNGDFIPMGGFPLVSCVLYDATTNLFVVSLCTSAAPRYAICELKLS